MEEQCLNEEESAGSKQQLYDDSEPERQKRPVKLTAKALLEKLQSLQAIRKAKLNKADKIKETIKRLMQNNREYENEVQSVFEKFKGLCLEAQEAHESLLTLLPDNEIEKHDIWYKAKMISKNEFIEHVNLWLSTSDTCQEITEGVTDANINDEVVPEDSVSNVSKSATDYSKHSSSSSSSTASARVQAEAERAALMARAAALKSKHAIETKQEELRKQKEQLELDAEIAASTAKLAVLSTVGSQSKCSRTGSSHSKGKEVTKSQTSRDVIGNGIFDSTRRKILNPQATEYVPTSQLSVATVGAKNSSPSQPTGTTSNFPSQSTKMQHKGGLNTYGTSTYQHQDSSQFVQHSSGSMATQALNPLPSYDEPLFEILKKQEELTAYLVHQAQPHTLPNREIPVFNGDPLHYVSFLRAFEHGVEERTRNKRDCLYFLEQFTTGQPKELVRSCQHLDPEIGYPLAKNLLKEQFGNDFKIAAAYMDKALGWPLLKAEDAQGLYAYSLFLRSCCNLLNDISFMQELNMPSNMRTVVMKLPFKLRERWREKACEIMDLIQARPNFSHLVDFIERHAKIVSDPVFGCIQDKQQVASKAGKVFKGNSFATNVVASVPVKNLQQGTRFVSKIDESKTCLLCQGNHVLERCHVLKKKSQREKIDFLKGKGICFSCLKSRHLSKECDNRLVCEVCKQMHPTVLHIYRKLAAGIPQAKDTEKRSSIVSTQTCGHTGAGNEKCLLSIIPVQVKSVKSQKVIQTYAFLDPGSSASFCSEQLMNELNIGGKKVNIYLRTMGQEQPVSCNVITGLEVCGINSNKFFSLPEVYTQKKLPVNSDNIVTQEDISKWPYLDRVTIPHIEANIGLLIGANASQVMEPWEIINSYGDGPYAIRTLLGWVVNGLSEASSNCEDETGTPSVTVNRISIRRLEELLQNQYNHDFNEIVVEKEEMSREDLQFMEMMKNSVKMQDGHYSLRLPFRSDDVVLPNNLSVAKQRCNGLRKRLERNQLLHEEYTHFLSDVLEKGYAEKVPEHQLDRDDGKVWYIPHHGVLHAKKGTLRVVFDCGATFRDTSLNKQLLQGPNLTNSLLGVLLRFRQETIALMADIQAMFHQVKVAEDDVDFLRFLWWSDGNLKQEVTTYRMIVHLFGAASSPSCACYALRRTAEDNQALFPSEVIDTVFDCFYVDDCLKSIFSEEAAIAMVQDLIALCQKGGFCLTKWTSNSRKVLQSVPEEYRSKDIQYLDLDRDKLPVERTLGLQWCAEADTFQFKLQLKPHQCTRRGILSTVSSVYDPMGFLAPLMLPAKLLLQEMCRQNLGWDEEIPPALRKQWTCWISNLDEVSEFQVGRCLKPTDFGEIMHACLHHFSDASEKGYGMVTYLRMINSDDKVHVTFLLAKSRVAPLKTLTIPRLELTAAVLSVKVDQMLRRELRLQLENSVFWTDSQTVLKYIKNEDKRFQTFVANRVSYIRDRTLLQQWRYVATKENPADDASRGMHIKAFMHSKRWIAGPSFLWRTEEHQLHPKEQIVDMHEDDDPEIKKDLRVNAVIMQDIQNASNCLITHFSDWKKLKVAVAWMLKVKKLLKLICLKRKELLLLERNCSASKSDIDLQMKSFKATLGGQFLSLEDLFEAEIAIVRFSQQQEFRDEI